MTPCPDKEVLLHGLVDGELDAANTLALEAHVRTCPGCAETLAQLRALRDRIDTPRVRYAAPDRLRARVAAMVDAEARPVSRPRPGPLRVAAPWAAAGAAGAIAASLALMLAAPLGASDGLQDDLIADHVRSLLASHLTDVATSDRHTVKPWFNGRIDFAPPVVDLADEGFPLAGGRLDYVRDRVVAALVYRRRLHVINLFVWPAARDRAAERGEARRKGYGVVWWTRGGLEFWAVSDMDQADLTTFRDAFEARTKT